MHGLSWHSRRPDVGPFAPRRRFWAAADHSSGAHQLALPDRSPRLGTTFRSPGTTARFRTPIPGSTLPACSLYALRCFPRTRSACRSLTLIKRDRRFKPVARFGHRFPSHFPDLRSPLGAFVPLRIEAFNPTHGRKAHLAKRPIPLRSPKPGLFLNPASDHRSEFRYASLGLLSLEPLGTISIFDESAVTVKRNRTRRERFSSRNSTCFFNELAARVVSGV